MVNRRRRRDGSCMIAKSKLQKKFGNRILDPKNDDVVFSDEDLKELRVAIIGLCKVSTDLEELQGLVEDYIGSIQSVVDDNARKFRGKKTA